MTQASLLSEPEQIPEFPGPPPGQKCTDPNIVAKHTVACIWGMFRPEENFDVELCMKAVDALDETFYRRVLQHVHMMLERVGERGKCQSCGAVVYWLIHRKTGKKCPYNQEGFPHFVDCPNANGHRKR